MRLSIRRGFSFGLTSGIITTLGLIIGLFLSTSSRLAVIGGILIIAIADAFSDSLGMHISVESENLYTEKQIWQSTVLTFFSKLIFALTFIIPILLLELRTAVYTSIAWGFFALIILNYQIAKREHINPLKVITEHLVIAVIIIIISALLGNWIPKFFS